MNLLLTATAAFTSSLLVYHCDRVANSNIAEMTILAEMITTLEKDYASE